MSNPETEGSTAEYNPKAAAMSGWIGSALEYYDFALYSQAAALVFPTIFFPTDNATVALISSLATYAVGYVSRPIGAVVLGAWGDRRGRKSVLTFAMLLMGFATLAVGLLPTYGQVGILAPIMLVTLRVVQGFAVAGELGGATAMIVEHSPDGKRGFFASFSLQGTQVGSILATAIMLPMATFLSDEHFESWGWRVPFLLSSVVIIAGYIIRQRVQEPPSYLEQQAANQKREFPVVELFRSHLGIALRCMIMTFTNVVGMVTLVFGITYATAEGYGIEYSKSTTLWVTLVANVTAVFTIPLFGALSDRIGRKKLMIAGGLGGGIGSVGYLWAVSQQNLVLIFASVILVHGVLFQMWNATYAAFFQEQFPTRIRVTGFALSQNVGLAIAAFFPSIFAAVAPPGGDHIVLTIGVTAVVICVAGALAAVFSGETMGKSLSDLDGPSPTTPIDEKPVTV
ncbi:MHS family MFS transporter [Kineosporia sp. J2-2]|uniref:MHS family MFS transporter n=1 Tax=Kineosporia corallincola TaxID=2835133 RepID=A0ABS5TRX3_9ACTN|nr:MFS transporter [Kineosporia corallincola]MBT0773543.1 MHS family MFS transporter [Kineosporia corallincola]